jgi:hypothetical protein
MKKLLTPILLASLALSVQFAAAQSPARAIQAFETDGVSTTLFNSADGSWDLEIEARYEVPRGSGKHAFFTHSMWMGGFDAGNQLHMSANTYRQIGEDFYSGPVANPGAYHGIGFDGALSFFPSTLITHSSGKLVAVTQDSVVIHDPVSGITTRHGLPINPIRTEAFELTDGRIFVLGTGSLTAVQPSYLFDINNFLGGMSLNTLGPHHNSAIVHLRDGRVLLHGGVSNEIFSPVSNTFTAFPLAPVQQCFRSGVQLANDSVMFFGGNAGCSSPSNGSIATFYYDLGAAVWSTGPNMNQAHFSPSIVPLPSGELLIFGGNYNDSLVERYNPISGAISPAGYLPYNSITNDAVLLPDGRVLIATRNSSGFHYGVFYDPSTQVAVPMNLILHGNNLALSSTNDLYVELDPSSFRRYDLALRTPTGQRFQRFWELTSAQITQFRADYLANTVNFANYPDIQTWPGNGDAALGEAAQLAPYIDVNMDGRYRPAVDGDYPCIAGDHAIWWIFNDQGPHTETSGLPMGVEVEAMVYAVDCDLSPCPDSSFRNHLFTHLELTNRSIETYHDVFVGRWMDVDLGNWADDYIGCDTSLGLGYVYNADANDEGPQGYGLTPPAAGILALPNANGNRLGHFQYYENDFSLLGNPTTASEYYGYLVSVWKDGQHVVDNGLNGYPGTAPGTPTNYMFPGDPACGGPSGWNEASAGNTPFDRRMVVSHGPFDLAPEATISVDYGILFAQGSSNLNSVCALKSTSQTTLDWWSSFDRNCFELVVDSKTPMQLASWTLYPNPARDQAQLVLSSPALMRTDVDLLDLTGRTVRTWTLAPGHTQHTCDLQGLSDGIYLVQVRDAAGTPARKLIVQH